MELNLPKPIVEVAWLSRNWNHPDLVILDASYHLPSTGRDAKTEFLEDHIPRARFFDFHNVICDLNSELPHMMPNEKVFSTEVEKLGVSNDSKIVVYDSVGMFSAPRAWWMFRAMGHDEVAVLNGGLPAWEQFALPDESGEAYEIKKGTFRANPRKDFFVNKEFVSSILDKEGNTIIDARSEDRFNALKPEPREGLRSGHIPGSKNLPYKYLLQHQKMLDVPSLQRAFRQHAGEQDQVVFSCGSGVTACILALGAEMAGYKNISVYDGSWTEWGQDESLPVES